MTMIMPLSKQFFDYTNYPKRESTLFRIAYALSCVTPVLKERLPRYLGLYFGKGQRYSVRTPHDAYIAVDQMNVDHYTRMQRLGGWDDHVLSTCIALLPAKGIFYDVGANGGYMSVCAASHFRGDIHVVSIEPQPDLARLTGISMLINGFTNFDVFPVLLGDTEKDEKFYLTADSVHASMKPRVDEHRRFKVKATVSVPMTTLDALVSKYKAPTPNVIKLDVEGAELLVLKGGRNTLLGSRPAVILESDANMQRFGYSRRDLVSFFEDCGYDGYYSIRSDGTYAALEQDAEGRCTGDIVVVSKERITADFAAKIIP